MLVCSSGSDTSDGDLWPSHPVPCDVTGAQRWAEASFSVCVCGGGLTVTMK